MQDSSNEGLLYNLSLIGPDGSDTQGPTKRPDFSLPAPGPDNRYFSSSTRAAGYKLGSYLNVYNFDNAINKILNCRDWTTYYHPIYQSYHNGYSMVTKIVGRENFLSIERPDLNTIPKNVIILIQEGMEKGSSAPIAPSRAENKYHFHYDVSTQEEKKQGWWISEELKAILESVYGWRFFEGVSLEKEFNEFDVFRYLELDGQWQGGIEKTINDAQFHDLNLAINYKLNLANSNNESDLRASGDSINVVALFRYVPVLEGSAEIEAEAILEGNCSDGFETKIVWNRLISPSPDFEVSSYTISYLSDSESELEELHQVQDNGSATYFWHHTLADEAASVPSYPKYFISWTGSDGRVSPQFEINKTPYGFEEYGIPTCDLLITLTKSYTGQCWTKEYGAVKLSWDISLPDNTEIETITLTKTRGSVINSKVLENDVRTFTDFNAKYDSSLDDDITYFLTVRIKALASLEEIKTAASNTITHHLEACDCESEDISCNDKCWVRGNGTLSCDSQQKEVFEPELLVWMENYIEDPFSLNPSASFDIKYCIADKCSNGINDFRIRMILPDTFNILAVSSSHGAVSFQSDFYGGGNKNEWFMEASSSFMAGPTHGTLCQVKIDKPLSNNRITFMHNACIFNIENLTYDWSNNIINHMSVEKEWQSGPPLSICTDETDIGYGDYLIDLRAIDVKTFDINFCLSRDDFDTFVLVVMNTDFKTKVDSVDRLVGLAPLNGWSISHKEISPGLSVIMGHGDKTISSSGYETLLRVVLSESSLDRDINSCICVFPFVLRLGEYWPKFSKFADSYIEQTNRLNKSHIGYVKSSYEGHSASGFEVTDNFTSSNNKIVSRLKDISDNIDPRFREMVCCLREAYKNEITAINNREGQVTIQDYADITYTTQLFITMITVFSNISVTKSEQINILLDNIGSLANITCNNFLYLEVDDTSYEEDDEITVNVRYCFPAQPVSGVQFEVNIPEDFAIDRNGLIGEAKDKQFLQILGTNGNYISVYDYRFANYKKDKKIQYTTIPEASYLLSDNFDPENPSAAPILTSFKLIFGGESADKPSISELKLQLGIIGEENGVDITSISRIVSNSIMTTPEVRWNGDWYNIDQREETNIHDFLVSLILCSGGKDDLSSPDEVIVLPNDQTVTKFYFSNRAYDLTNLTYDPITYLGKEYQNLQEYMLDFLDANGDGVADVSDVVALRNLFSVLGKTRVPRREVSAAGNIVPTQVCTIQDYFDYELFIPDECSNFCIKPACSSDIWISDVINTGKGTLIEVSYSAQCDDQKISGVQFTIEGLYKEGILSCINGESDTGTVFSEKGWQFHVLSSTGFPTRDTVIAYAKNSNDYLTSKTGILTYLLLNKESVYGRLDREEVLRNFIKTNGNLLVSSHKKTSEITSNNKFGLKVGSWLITNNSQESLAEPSSTFNVEISKPESILSFISNNYYNQKFDSKQDKNGKLNLIDVQAAYHNNNLSSFEGMENDRYVPGLCCPKTLPSDFKLRTGDFTSEQLVLDIESEWVKSRTYDLSQFTCGKKLQGGVVIAWTPSEGADYYIVYRRSVVDGSIPIPIIGSKVGILQKRNTFDISSTYTARTPEQIDSTVWLDFPPPTIDSCCEWCPDEDDEVCIQSIENQYSSQYEYYVVAFNEAGQTRTNISTAKLACCDFAPKALDSYVLMTGYADLKYQSFYSGIFDVRTKDSTNIYCYTTKSGKKDKTNKGGEFIVESGPLGLASTPNTLGFKYIPPVNFYGEDYIDFKVSSEKTNSPSFNWCESTARVNIFVYPPNTNFLLIPGQCGDSAKRGTCTIRWKLLPGATSYRIFRDGEQIAEVGNEINSYTDDSISLITQTDCSGGDRTEFSYSIAPIFIYKGKELFTISKEAKIAIECCGEIENPQVNLIKKADICDDQGNSKKGSIQLTWNDGLELNNYKVYKRESNSNDFSQIEWRLIDFIGNDGRIDSQGIATFVDSVKDCRGCGSKFIQYAVTSVTSRGEGEIGDNLVTVELNCCNSTPVTKNQEFITLPTESLSGKKLLAFDKDNDITQYSVISELAPSEAGSLILNDQNGTFNFTPNPSFRGNAQFTWRADDLCGNSSSSIVTISIISQEECNEDNYVICNATIPFLTSQQDIEGIRKKSDTLPQVPFSLNNKGASSLRKRCGAYSASVNPDPSLFGSIDDECFLVNTGFFTHDNMKLPIVSLELGEDVLFIEYKDDFDGIPAVVINLEEGVQFIEFKETLINQIPEVFLTEELAEEIEATFTSFNAIGTSNSEFNTTTDIEVSFATADAIGTSDSIWNVELSTFVSFIPYDAIGTSSVFDTLTEISASFVTSNAIGTSSSAWEVENSKISSFNVSNAIGTSDSIWNTELTNIGMFSISNAIGTSNVFNTLTDIESSFNATNAIGTSQSLWITDITDTTRLTTFIPANAIGTSDSIFDTLTEIQASFTSFNAIGTSDSNWLTDFTAISSFSASNAIGTSDSVWNVELTRIGDFTSSNAIGTTTTFETLKRVSLYRNGTQYVEGVLSFEGNTEIVLSNSVFNDTGDYLLFDYSNGSFPGGQAELDLYVTINDDDLILSSFYQLIDDPIKKRIILKLRSRPTNGKQFVEGNLTFIGPTEIVLSEALYATPGTYELFEVIGGGTIDGEEFLTCTSEILTCGTPYVSGNIVYVELT